MAIFIKYLAHICMCTNIVPEPDDAEAVVRSLVKHSVDLHNPHINLAGGIPAIAHLKIMKPRRTPVDGWDSQSSRCQRLSSAHFVSALNSTLYFVIWFSMQNLVGA